MIILEKRFSMGILAIVVAGLLAIGASGCGKDQPSGEEGQKVKVRILKLAHGMDVEDPVHKALLYMADLVDKKTEGRLRVDIYPSEQLGSEREYIEKLQFGSLDMCKCSSSPLESFVPTLKVLGMPYLFRDGDHYWTVLSGPIGKEILASGESRGLKGLCYYDAGVRSFYTCGKPIHSPEDLKGLKIRVQKSALSMTMIQMMGGSATPIDYGELYSALQQGVVDGAENNPPSFHTARHYEVCKYYSLDEHTRPPDVLLMNTDSWKRLPAEFQKALQESVDESVVYHRKLWNEKVEESMRVVREAGVEVIEVDKEPFRKAVEPMWDEFKGTEIEALKERIEAVQ